MSQKKKKGKERLDKYYRLAKEQGYRARSAFKLIQLNKKYGFLGSARVLVDLCAAPGGWLQVARKYMPVSSIVVGIDLVPIKPIQNVITCVEDITSDKCRQTLKRELKDWKADVVLHDGAPNVGTAWVQDAYSQSELVLKSLKLATEFLMAGGWFITKIFRSRDYNSLLWVFHQLFEKVEPTKPASSRQASAEIFVVCKGYLAPKKLDPKFLDPRHVFEDLDFVQKGTNIFKPTKKERSREGYADGSQLLFKKISAYEFLKSNDPIDVMSTTNQISFDIEDSKPLLNLRATTEEIRHFCEDLKILSRRDFKLLLKWRISALKELEDNSKGSLQSVSDGIANLKQEIKREETKNDDRKLEYELISLEEQSRAKQRRAKKRDRLIREKSLSRMRLGIETDFGEDAPDDRLFSIRSSNTQKDLESFGLDDEDEKQSEIDTFAEEDDVERDYHSYLDETLEEMYAEYKKRTVGDRIKIKGSNKGKVQSMIDVNETDGKESDPTLFKEKKTLLWYDRPEFGTINSNQDETHEKCEPVLYENLSFESDDGDLLETPFEDPDRSSGTEGSEYKSVPTATDRPKLNLPEELSLAAAMKLKGRKEEIMDAAYNRYASGGDENLPDWFVDEESRHRVPILPVSKEEIDLYRVKMKEINSRPIKKVTEARARKRMKLLSSQRKIKRQSDMILNSEDITEKQKAMQISKLKLKTKKTKKEVTYVVAKGANRGRKGRPKGLKGHYKMVDARMRKDTRAQKRKAK